MSDKWTAAQVLSVRCPSCAACAESPFPCPRGCDTLPAEVTLRPEGASGAYVYLANHRTLGTFVRALSSPDGRIILTPDEADGLISQTMLDELAYQDVTYQREEERP